MQYGRTLNRNYGTEDTSVTLSRQNEEKVGSRKEIFISCYEPFSCLRYDSNLYHHFVKPHNMSRKRDTTKRKRPSPDPEAALANPAKRPANRRETAAPAPSNRTKAGAATVSRQKKVPTATSRANQGAEVAPRRKRAVVRRAAPLAARLPPVTHRSHSKVRME